MCYREDEQKRHMTVQVSETIYSELGKNKGKLMRFMRFSFTFLESLNYFIRIETIQKFNYMIEMYCNSFSIYFYSLFIH